MLREVITSLDNIHERSTKYPGALVVFPKKDWITMQNAKVELCIKIQSKYKLAKEVEKVLASYRHLFSGLESMIENHGFPSIREIG